VAQDDIVESITNLIDSDNLPHLLLYGPPGTGKTSTIVAAAKRMYGSTSAYQSMTLELNASDARGIDVSSNIRRPPSLCLRAYIFLIPHVPIQVVRNEIKEFAGTKQLFSKGIKLIVSAC
jgi:replication factor C subunit 3/5